MNAIARNRIRAEWSFAAPGLTMLAVVMGFPLLYALAISLSSMTMIKPALSFVGMANFLKIAVEPLFWHSLWLTLRYSAAAVIGEFVIGLAIALMLQQVFTARGFYFAILTVPMAMSPVAVALIWRMLLQPNLGIVNETLAAMGLPMVDWLGDSSIALSTLISIDIWQQTSFRAPAVGRSRPEAAYEAAEVDGAGPLQQFWYITLPLLRPVSVIAIVIQLINEFRTYDLIYDLTKGGPGVSTELLSFFAYKRAFQGLQVPEGSAAAITLLLIILTITVVFFWLIERRKS